ncbi:MAG: hypothetical protein K0R65_427 [Crocinitomicaceae bacterium]|jgi:hypothetical protein|nr:hypothetical protein [Crocinitomicaceae bacterium]
MAKRQLKNGTCYLCNEIKMLNFEHVPPRSTFNKNTRFREIPYEDFMKDDPLNRKIKGKPKQGGVGFYSYCESCNNFLGKEYVRSFKEWTHIGAYILSHGEFDIYEYSVYKQKPNKILKQIVSMFISINQVDFAKRHPDLITFIKNTGATELNDRYRFFVYLNNVGNYRHLPYMVTGNLLSREIIQCCEIAFPPFGYVMTIDSDPQSKYLAEITHFKNYEFDKETDLNLKIARLQTNLPIPLDYRTKEEIETAIKG